MTNASLLNIDFQVSEKFISNEVTQDLAYLVIKKYESSYEGLKWNEVPELHAFSYNQAKVLKVTSTLLTMHTK